MEKLLVTSNFSFSHNVFYGYISLLCQNVALCGNELAFPKQQLLDTSKLKEFADNNFKFVENGRSNIQARALWLSLILEAWQTKVLLDDCLHVTSDACEICTCSEWLSKERYVSTGFRKPGNT